MYIYYTDESYDRQKFAVTAFGIADKTWLSCLDKIKNFRKTLRDRYGIKLKFRLHARTFIRHCNDGAAKYPLSLSHRREVFEKCLDLVATLPVEIINICLPLSNFGIDTNRVHEAALDRLFNRIQATASSWTRKTYAITIFDRGKEKQITKLSRKMSVFNYIPSQFGGWSGGKQSRNIVIDRVLEDPIFRDSADSYFLQLEGLQLGLREMPRPSCNPSS